MMHTRLTRLAAACLLSAMIAKAFLLPRGLASASQDQKASPELSQLPNQSERHFETTDIYEADRAGKLSPVVQNFASRVYVPNSESASVDVIDPASYRVVDHFGVGLQPQHIVPAYDLKTLWVLDDKGNSLTKIDPATAKEGGAVPVDDPYNMYFTPDGSEAIVVAESLHRLDFRDAQTMELKYSRHIRNSQRNRCRPQKNLSG